MFHFPIHSKTWNKLDFKLDHEPILVGGLEHVLFSISYMGCHPSH